MESGKGISRREFLKVTGVYLAGKLIPKELVESDKLYRPETIYGNEKELKGRVFITIDDCAMAKYTLQMVDILASVNAKATFFPNSDRLMGQYMLWRRIYHFGHDIGYHTTNHTLGLTVNQLIEDRKKFEVVIRELTGNPNYSVVYVRPPYGDWDKNWTTWAKANSLTTIRWNYAPGSKHNLDYFRTQFKSINGGGIILIHPRPWDTQWLEDNIKQLKRMAVDHGHGLETFSMVYIKGYEQSRNS